MVSASAPFALRALLAVQVVPCVFPVLLVRIPLKALVFVVNVRLVHLQLTLVRVLVICVH